ncbi:hypothetical protein GCM10020254_27600 [Streptomyces goshikiensis]
MAWVRGARAVAAAVLGEVDEFQGVLGAAEVDHLAAHVGEDVRAQRLVPGLLGGVQGEDEVLLRGRVQADVVAHPAGQFGELGGDLEEPLHDRGRVVLLEQVGDLVELAHDGLAAQSAAALGVPLAEHHGGGFEEVELRPGQPRGGGARRRPPARHRCAIRGRRPGPGRASAAWAR